MPKPVERTTHGREMNARMKQAMEKTELSQTKFGELAGIGSGTIKNIVYDRTEPNPLFFDLLYKAHNINKEWVETGTGEMFVDQTAEERISEFVGKALAEEGTFKKSLIQILANLDEEGWKKLDEAAKALLDAQEQSKGGGE